MDVIALATVSSLLTVGIKHAFTVIRIISQYTNVRNVMRSQATVCLLLKINQLKSLVIFNHNRLSLVALILQYWIQIGFGLYQADQIKISGNLVRI